MPKPVADLLKAFGVTIPSTWLVVLGVLLVVGAAAIAWWLKRKAAAAAPPPAAAPDAGSAQAQIAPKQLRRAFQRFASQLPAEYQRSLLNFEHFVVLGPASSGKSRVIDQATDWKRRSKEFVSSQSVDPDLQVYVTSSAVVTELPARILEDHSARARTALRHLWKPLYAHRAPTVVVVVDAMRLGESTSDAVKELAETLRAKVNVIAEIRKAPVEVRVVLTRLDQLPGYQDFVDFAIATGLPTRIPFSAKANGASKDKVDIAGDLDRWFEELRGHLPRALTLLPSDAYRRVVVFCRRLPETSEAVVQFLGALFAHESLSPDPIAGGVHLVANDATVSNPLLGAADAGPGPDPRRRHLVLAAAFSGLAVVYLSLAYAQQRALFSRAATDLDDYSPSTYGKERESRRREGVVEFTYKTRGIMMRYPDFFSSARTKMRKRFAEAIREELLIPRLRQVSTKGAPDDGGIALPQRRSLYYLALVHSDASDRMRILDRQKLDIWSSMTGLSTELIKDYLNDVDAPLQRPVDFDLPEHELDPSDSSASWVLFFRQIQEGMADGQLTPEELSELRVRAEALTKALDRFDHDDVTQKILDELDDAAGLGDKGGGRLKQAYQSKYGDFLANIASSDVLGQRDSLRRVLSAVQKASLESGGATLLRGLVDRVSTLYASASARPDEVIKVKLAGQEYVFDFRKWDETLLDSSAGEEISQFIRRSTTSASIFFGTSDDDLRPIVWNPTNDGTVFFLGRASIDGRYTKPAYDKRVRETVKKLGEVLEKNHIPENRKQRLREFVKEQVRRYAAEYRRQLIAFYREFKTSASSPESVRVLIAQMVSDTSPFNDFVSAVDKQVTLDSDDALLEPMEDVTSEFAAWHAAVSPGAGAPELAKYKAILGQLLADLGPAAEQASQAATAKDVAAAELPTEAPGQTLQKMLSPAGRLVLANLRGDAGSYGQLVFAWAASIHVPEYQQAPFLAPIQQLAVIGRRDVENAIRQAWDHEMATDIQRLATRFPFAREANEDASPQELTAVLHPQTGRFFDLYRRFLEPIAEGDAASGYRLRKALRGSLPNLPPDMFATLSQAAKVSSRLWDAAGRPVPLELRIATVPFEHGPDPRLALTLTYINVGETPVLNFNQKPTEKTVRFDWTKEQASQVGMQLTDLDSKESTFPDPLVVEASFWSFHKLLRKGTTAAVKFPPDATLHAWEIKVRKGRTDTGRVRFVVIGDPFQPFSLAKVGAPATPSAPRGRQARLNGTTQGTQPGATP